MNEEWILKVSSLEIEVRVAIGLEDSFDGKWGDLSWIFTREVGEYLERAIIVLGCVTLLGTPITITLVGYATSRKEYNPIKVNG